MGGGEANFQGGLAVLSKLTVDKGRLGGSEGQARLRGRLWEIGCLRRVACGDLLVREESSVTRRREEDGEGEGGYRIARQDKAREMERGERKRLQ